MVRGVRVYFQKRGAGIQAREDAATMSEFDFAGVAAIDECSKCRAKVMPEQKTVLDTVIWSVVVFKRHHDAEPPLCPTCWMAGVERGTRPAGDPSCPKCGYVNGYHAPMCRRKYSSG